MALRFLLRFPAFSQKEQNGPFFAFSSLFDDDELNINPPTPCQIGKRPPAPKPKRESAGHQGVAGGGYIRLFDISRTPSGTFFVTFFR